MIQCQKRASYGVTVTVTILLVMPPDVAVMFVVPDARGLTKPVLLMVAVAVLLDNQVATFVISCGPLHVVAMALNCTVPPPIIEIGPGFAGVIAID